MAKVNNAVPAANMQTAMVSPPAGWEASFLQKINAPDNPTSEQFLDSWYMAEHGALDANPHGFSGGSFGGLNNLFDTALPEPGSVTMAYGAAHDAGIQEYPNWQVGETANASTLEQSNMAPLLTALRSGNASLTDLETAEGQTQWAGTSGGQEPDWPSGKVPTSGTIGSGSGSGSSTLQNWQNIAPSFNGQTLGTTAPSSSSTTPASTALLTSAPWGGLLGSQIEEAVFFLLGAALVIVGLVITFKSGNEENPVKEAEHGAEVAAA